jgi:hypothetical protein
MIVEQSLDKYSKKEPRNIKHIDTKGFFIFQKKISRIYLSDDFCIWI